jgi:hypothetical protein
MSLWFVLVSGMDSILFGNLQGQGGILHLVDHWLEMESAPTCLEKRLRMRPAGVVSKKLIGERNMANAILSCNLREA